MTIEDLKIPGVQRFIARLLAEHGGRIDGTNQLYDQVPATPRGIRASLRTAAKYGLFRRAKSGQCGRGHKSTWRLTRKGYHYVKS